MDSRLFEAQMRRHEILSREIVFPGYWPVIRVDGRGFSTVTESMRKPFDENLASILALVGEALLDEFGGVYGYAQSDEVSVILPPDTDMFGRRMEKLTSVAASIAAALTSCHLMRPVMFDGRIFVGQTLQDVVDYLSWRQSDSRRNGISTHAYWHLREAGKSAGQATSALDGMPTTERSSLVRGVPTWTLHGIGIRKRRTPVPGALLVRQTSWEADWELPAGEAHRQSVSRYLQEETAGCLPPLTS